MREERPEENFGANGVGQNRSVQGAAGAESDGGGEGGLGGTRWWCEIESDRARPVQQAQETWQGSGACINMDDGPNCIFDAGAQRGMTDCSLTSYHLDSGSQARGRAWATAQQPTTTQDQGATTRKGPPPPPAIIAQRATTSLPRCPHRRASPGKNLCSDAGYLRTLRDSPRRARRATLTTLGNITNVCVRPHALLVARQLRSERASTTRRLRRRQRRSSLIASVGARRAILV